MEQKSLTQSFEILIAEDDRGMGTLVERILNRADFITHRVYNGRQTLDFCKTRSPEETFLLLDYELGDMTAEDVLNHLAAQGKKFPFITMTGHGNENTAVKMMKLGSEEYFIKGEDALELLIPAISHTIEQLITKQSLAQTQQALHTAHQAIMASDNGIVIAELSNNTGPIIYSNPAFETITGHHYSSNPTLNEWLDSYNQQQSGVQEIRTALCHLEPVQIQLKRSGHSIAWHEVNLSFIQESPDQNAVCIGVITDTTQKYLSEQEIAQLRWQLEQTQRQEIVGQISTELAHEIGRPLIQMSNKVQFMLNQDVIEKEELLSILSYIDRMTLLLQSYSRNGGETLSPTFVSIPSVLQPILHFCPCHDGISLSVDISDNLPEIHVDVGRISQILLNLVNNAFDACEHGGTIVLSAKVITHAEKEYVAISVKDTGSGISQELLKIIFAPFYSTKSSSRDRGLGLPISQNIARQHQGWIEVQSQPGEGACFTLMLPLSPVVAEQVDATASDGNNACNE